MWVCVFEPLNRYVYFALFKQMIRSHSMVVKVTGQTTNKSPEKRVHKVAHAKRERQRQREKRAAILKQHCVRHTHTLRNKTTVGKCAVLKPDNNKGKQSGPGRGTQKCSQEAPSTWQLEGLQLANKCKQSTKKEEHYKKYQIK